MPKALYALFGSGCRTTLVRSFVLRDRIAQVINQDGKLLLSIRPERESVCQMSQVPIDERGAEWNEGVCLCASVRTSGQP